MYRKSKDIVWIGLIVLVSTVIGVQCRLSALGFWHAQDFRLRMALGIYLYGPESDMLYLRRSRYIHRRWSDSQLVDITTTGRFSFSSGNLTLYPDNPGVPTHVLTLGPRQHEFPDGSGYDRFLLSKTVSAPPSRRAVKEEWFAGPRNPNAMYSLF